MFLSLLESDDDAVDGDDAVDESVVGVSTVAAVLSCLASPNVAVLG